jgi:Cu-Zn family superoxide dismutase
LNTRQTIIAVLILAIVIVIVVIIGKSTGPDMANPKTVSLEEPVLLSATAEIQPTKGYTAHGTVTFIQATGGVHVTVELQGLEPGKHGFHIHENGDCSAPDASSAGGHYNPTGQPHGARLDAERHVGDLGNVIADSAGDVMTDFIDSVITLEGEYSIVGHAVIVHANADDLTSQPSGNAGPRVGCGVIELDEQPQVE